MLQVTGFYKLWGDFNFCDSTVLLVANVLEALYIQIIILLISKIKGIQLNSIIQIFHLW